MDSERASSAVFCFLSYDLMKRFLGGSGDTNGLASVSTQREWDSRRFSLALPYCLVLFFLFLNLRGLTNFVKMQIIFGYFLLFLPLYFYEVKYRAKKRMAGARLPIEYKIANICMMMVGTGLVLFHMIRDEIVRSLLFISINASIGLMYFTPTVHLYREGMNTFTNTEEPKVILQQSIIEDMFHI